MKLYLLRHGEPEPDYINPQRPLTKNGKAEIEKLARFVGMLPVETIYHSGKTRAQETAQIIAQGKPILQRNDLNPNDELDSILEEISSSKINLMLVGHMPFLGRLASMLLAGNDHSNMIEFLPGTLICLEKENTDWLIREIISPEDLRNSGA